MVYKHCMQITLSFLSLIISIFLSMLKEMPDASNCREPCQDLFAWLTVHVTLQFKGR